MTCVNVAKVLNTDGVFNTLSHFFILLVPVKALWKLQMKTKGKVGIGLLFSVGLMYDIPTLPLLIFFTLLTSNILSWFR